jgi:predicted transcriptional regulator
VIKVEKEELKQLIDDLPENFTIEDIQYRLYVRSKIEKGLKDIEEGNVLTHDEVLTRMAQWIKK